MLRLAFDFIIAWRENTHEAECLPEKLPFFIHPFIFQCCMDYGTACSRNDPSEQVLAFYPR